MLNSGALNSHALNEAAGGGAWGQVEIEFSLESTAFPIAKSTVHCKFPSFPYPAMGCLANVISDNFLSGECEANFFECSSIVRDPLPVNAEITFEVESNLGSTVAGEVSLGITSEAFGPNAFGRCFIHPWWFECKSKGGIKQHEGLEILLNTQSEVSAIAAPGSISGSVELDSFEAASSVSFGVFHQSVIAFPYFESASKTGIKSTPEFNLFSAGAVNREGFAQGSCEISKFKLNASVRHCGAIEGECEVSFKAAGKIDSVINGFMSGAVQLSKFNVLSEIVWTNLMESSIELPKFNASAVAFGDDEAALAEVFLSFQAKGKIKSHTSTQVLKYTRDAQAVPAGATKPTYDDLTLRYQR